jgi:hypothetical protein
MAKQFIETTFEIKAVEDDGTFSGYAAVFGNVDSHRDILLPGSTAASIQESKGIFPILADHAMYEQIGYNKTAVEDNVGLLVSGALNMKVAKAVERHALAKQAQELGGTMGLSIGYLTIDYAIDEKEQVRKLKEVDIKEYSFTAFASNTRASVRSIKSIIKELDGFDIKNDPKTIEQILREVGFSVSVSKKAATTAIKLSNADHLREVDDNEVKDVLEVMKSMNRALKLSQAR